MQLFRSFRDQIRDQSFVVGPSFTKKINDPQSIFDSWIKDERQASRMLFTFGPNIGGVDPVFAIAQDHTDELYLRTLEDEDASWLPYPNVIFQLSQSVDYVLSDAAYADQSTVDFELIKALGTTHEMVMLKETPTSIIVYDFIHRPDLRLFMFAATFAISKNAEGYVLPTICLEGFDTTESQQNFFSQLKARLFFVLAMLDAERILIEPHAMKTANINGKRKRPKKILPVNEYKVLKLGLPNHIRDKERRELGEESVRQRFHWRRGHWRHFEKPRRDGRTKVRVKACCAGDPSLGIIHKDYHVY